MESKIDFNLKSVEPFSRIDDSFIDEIEKNIELIKYNFGQPICALNTIPNKILFILKGEVRFLHLTQNKPETIKKLGPSNFIGLASLLNAKGIEFFNASSEVTAISLPDSLILKIYQNDKYFKSWCDNHIQIADLYKLALKLKNLQVNDSLKLSQIVNSISKEISISTIENGDKFEVDSKLISFLSSSNVINNIAEHFLEDSQIISTRGPLPARILKISCLTSEKIIQNKFISNTIKDSSSQLANIDSSKIKDAVDLLEESSEKVGQYNQEKKFKIYRAKGPVKESMACLKMLSSELDLPYRVDSIEKILLDTIRRGKKPTIEVLGGITAMMGLHSSSTKVAPKLGTRLPKYSIISWGESFALVKDSNSKYLEIVSPSEGLINLKADKLSEAFDKGFIELLLVEKNDQTPESKFGLNWLLPAINRYRNVLLQVLLASFVVQLFGLANPLMIQVIIDKVISQRSLDTLQILGIALVFVTILGGVISSLRTFLFNETTNRIDTRLGAEVIDHLLRLPLNYFDRRPVGELGSRVAELEKIRNFLTGQALTTILDALFSLIYIVVMVIYSWLLTIIALGVVPIQILITLIGTPLIRRQVRNIAQENAKTQSHLVEVLTGIQTVKAQNVERVSRWKWQELYSEYISKSFQKTLTGTALGETSQVLQQLSQLLVLWIGARLVLSGELTLGQLIAFRIISGYVTQPLLRLSTIWQNVQELRISFERLADIIDTPEEASETDKAKIPLPSIEGKVIFENLSFAFNRGQPPVLKKINLEIQPGQFVGIVGQSGSGKSTLMKLIPRLYKPDEGRITIDGYDVNKVELYSLRRQIGIVPQEPLLFAGSINENIALTDPESASDEIVKASKIASAHDFIMELSDGYSTNIGERGAGLSGGQKQRIAIARTLLSNPKLLIMDESTSALDYETERKVCEGLRASCKESTVFFITHRLSTVRNADIIVMLDQGTIVEIGTHNQLMEKKGRYYALFIQQEST